MTKIALLPVAIIGASPEGVSLSRELSDARIPHRIFATASVDERSSRPVPHLEEVAVAAVRRGPAGFVLMLATGERLRAARVVIARPDTPTGETSLARLDSSLRREIGATPALSRHGETSSRGLYVLDATRSSGKPGAAARRLARRFERDGVAAVADGTPGTTPRLLFLSLGHDIGSERIVAQFGRDGATCAVVGLAESFAMASRFVADRVTWPSSTFFADWLGRQRLERFVQEWVPDAMIPLDDRAASTMRQLARHHATSGGLRALIASSIGASPGVARLDAAQAAAIDGPGALVTQTIVCRNGCVIDGFAVVAEQTDGTPPRATIVSCCDDEDVRAAAATMAARIGLSGFASFDVARDADDQVRIVGFRPYAIGTAHLGRHYGHDLCRAFLAGLLDHRWTPAKSRSTEQRIALFPDELMRAPAASPIWSDPTLRHDVAIDDGDVIHRYLADLKSVDPDAEISVLRLMAREAIFAPVRSDEPAAAAA